MLTPSHETGPKLKHTGKFDKLFVDTSIISKNFQSELNVHPLPTKYDIDDYLNADLNNNYTEHKLSLDRLSPQYNNPLPRNVRADYGLRYSMDPTLVHSKSDNQMKLSTLNLNENVESNGIDIIPATAPGSPITYNISRPLSVPGPPIPISAAMFSPPSINPHLANGIPLRRPYSHSISLLEPPTPVKETYTITLDYDPVTGNKLINNYEVLKELGRGCHGKVKLGRDTRNGELVAIKIIHKNTRRRLGSKSAISTQMAKVQREIAILKKCNHPNVVQLKEVIDDPAARKIYMILEYMDGGEVKFTTSDTDSLSLNSDSTSCLDKSTIRHIMRSVVVGLEYLHVQGIIHRDIKPANLLWSSDGQVKISDFGVSFCKRSRSPTPSGSYSLNYRSDSFSTSMDGSSTHSESPQLESYITSPITDSYIPENLPFSRLLHRGSNEDDDLELAKTAGSPAFFAPELCWSGDTDGTLGNTRPPITNKIDVWALGITLYCLAFGHPPFSAETEFELFELIPRQNLTFPNGAEKEDPLLCDLIKGLLTKDQTQRFSLAQVRSHPWILEDLNNPKQWVIESDPKNHDKVEVTEEEVKCAVTIKDRIRKHLRKLSESIMKSFVK